MANPEHVKILDQGVAAWNEWRRNNPWVQVDFTGIDLLRAQLTAIDFSGVDLSHSNLRLAQLSRASFREADLSHAVLSEANLSNADLILASLSDAVLERTELHSANLGACSMSDAVMENADLSFTSLFDIHARRVNLKSANLTGAYFSFGDIRDANLAYADLSQCTFYAMRFEGVNLTQASFLQTGINDVDLTQVCGLEAIQHHGPSSISFGTLQQSGRLPEGFLRGCGVPEAAIQLSRSMKHDPMDYYSCFISYSHKDEEFAQRLYNRMQEAGLRVWYAPESIQGGQKIHEQLQQAISEHDRLLLVLSEESMNSRWVGSEIHNARMREVEENRRILFPIRLVEFDKLKEWSSFDADIGKDSGQEVREYFIPDFSNWRDDAAFEKAFERLLRDLKAEDKT